MLLKSERGAWKEEINDYTIDTATAFSHATDMIAQFNNSLRPGETRRDLLLVRTKFTSVSNEGLKHLWEKWGAVTQQGGFDTYKCKICGATGKRFGLSDSIIIDKKYKKLIYCPNKYQR